MPIIPNQMIVEIRNIDSDAFGAILAGIDLIGLKELTNVFARWAFELEWPEIADIPQEQLDLVIRAFDAGCRSYSMRFDSLEYTKQDLEPDNDPDNEQDVSDDEPAPDLQTIEELQAVKEVKEEKEETGGKKRRYKRKKVKNDKKSKEPVELEIDRIETEQREDLISLIQEIGLPEIATAIEKGTTRTTIPAVESAQIGKLREILDALCTRYKVRVGAVRFISN